MGHGVVNVLMVDRHDRPVIAVPLGRSDDPRHGADRFDRIVTGGTLRRQHDRITAVEHGGGNVGCFCAGRGRGGDHALQHLRCDDHRLAGLAAGADDIALIAGHIFRWQFDTEVTTGNHDGIGQTHDLFQMADRAGLLDLGAEADIVADPLACLIEIIGALDKGQGNPVNAKFLAGFGILEVFFGQSQNIDIGTGQVYALAIPERAIEHDFGRDFVIGDTGNPEPHLAVINHQLVAGHDRAEDFRMRQLHPFGVADHIIEGEDKTLSGFQLGTVIGEGADAEFRPLQILQDGDRSPQFLLDLADGFHALTVIIRRAVTEVQAEDIDAGFGEFTEHFLGTAGGANGGNDFCATGHVMCLGILGFFSMPCIGTECCGKTHQFIRDFPVRLRYHGENRKRD